MRLVKFLTVMIAVWVTAWAGLWLVRGLGYGWIWLVSRAVFTLIIVSALALVCALARRQGRPTLLMTIGLLLLTVSAACTLAAQIWIWGFGDPNSVWGRPFGEPDPVWGLLQSVSGVAIAAGGLAALCGGLAMLRIDRPWVRKLRVLAAIAAVCWLPAFAVTRLSGPINSEALPTLATVSVAHLVLAVLLVRGFRDRDRQQQFVRIVVLSYVGAAMILVWSGDTVVLLELVPALGRIVSSQIVPTALAALAIAGTAVVVVAATMEWMDRRHAAIGGGPVSVTCPRCDSAQQIRTGGDACRSCGLRFRLWIEEPRCACGYVLHRTAADVCPECGRAAPISPASTTRSAGRLDCSEGKPRTNCLTCSAANGGPGARRTAACG